MKKTSMLCDRCRSEKVHNDFRWAEVVLKSEQITDPNDQIIDQREDWDLCQQCKDDLIEWMAKGKKRGPR